MISARALLAVAKFIDFRASFCAAGSTLALALTQRAREQSGEKSEKSLVSDAGAR